jgi:hypothetical protein
VVCDVRGVWCAVGATLPQDRRTEWPLGQELKPARESRVSSNFACPRRVLAVFYRCIRRSLFDQSSDRIYVSDHIFVSFTYYVDQLSVISTFAEGLTFLSDSFIRALIGVDDPSEVNSSPMTLIPWLN